MSIDGYCFYCGEFTRLVYLQSICRECYGGKLRRIQEKAEEPQVPPRLIDPEVTSSASS